MNGINMLKKNSNENNYTVVQNNINYDIEKRFIWIRLDFYKRLDEILGIISSDDYFKLICLLALA